MKCQTLPEQQTAQRGQHAMFARFPACHQAASSTLAHLLILRAEPAACLLPQELNHGHIAAS